ncbi:thiol-disulfide isomerase/thioredoxin [Silvimonas terrae]|uniref:Thiol-disulfide isomerase/thioredoxin n=1 Tax=Silvimonas terrae TaxID=300266 RepID=A0A840RDW7_9NEIS|nr:TlpA disulfide reductase family protein [Silvimonas terrae]MBB5191525.1 thiol-disulfide isomerase/thioredoxin [Silvimonas terrae]
MIRTGRFLRHTLLALCVLAASQWALADASLDTPLKDLQGKPQKLSQYSGKQPLVINFWASWCGPCRQETPDLVKLEQSYHGKVQFVGVAIDEPAPVAQFAKQYKVTYPILLGSGDALELMTKLGNNAGALPFTVVIDTKGNVVVKDLGQVKPAEMKKTLDGLLGKKG